VKSANICQTHSKYLVADSFTVESVDNVVDGKLMDESKTCLLASIDTFCFFIEMVSNEKNMKRASMNQCYISVITHFRNPTKRKVEKA